jgi:hypothetical protein
MLTYAITFQRCVEGMGTQNTMFPKLGYHKYFPLKNSFRATVIDISVVELPIPEIGANLKGQEC